MPGVWRSPTPAIYAASLGDPRETFNAEPDRSIRSRRLPLAGAFLLLQGIVEIMRCVICISEGEWPSRAQDVEEVDVDKLKEMVHVKDEDIAGARPARRAEKGSTK